jgi:ribA/ribD-fused uncharacterized protein
MSDKILFNSKIRAFEWLSSFYPCNVRVDVVETNGKRIHYEFESVEHGYQFLKICPSDSRRKDLLKLTQAGAKRDARKLKQRHRWKEDELDLRVMFALDTAKFNQNAELYALLMLSEDRPLLEHAPWEKPNYWGTDLLAVGPNWKGKIVMRVRERLRSHASNKIPTIRFDRRINHGFR